MTEEPQADNPRGLGHTLGRLDVGVARLGISARVVVGERECTAVAAQRRVEDLPDRHRSPIHRALRHHKDSQRTIRGVTRDDEHLLAAEAAELALRDRRDIGRSTDDGRQVR